MFVCAGANHWLRLSVAEGELSQHNLAVQRQLEEAADTWGRQMADLQAACEQRVAGAHERWCHVGVSGAHLYRRLTAAQQPVLHVRRQHC